MAQKKKSKKRKIKKNKAKQLKKKPLPEKEITSLKRFLKVGWALFFAFIAIAGFCLALYSYFPRINIYPSETLYPQNPFKNPFYIYLNP